MEQAGSRQKGVWLSSRYTGANIIQLPIFSYHFCGALLLCPCLFHPSDNPWRSQRADVHRCANFSTVISPSWITEQISVGKWVHRGASVPTKFQNCHLDKTNMDKTSQHPYDILQYSFFHSFVRALCLPFFYYLPHPSTFNKYTRMKTRNCRKQKSK